MQFAAMPTNFVWLSFFWIMGKCEHHRPLGFCQSVAKQ